MPAILYFRSFSLMAQQIRVSNIGEMRNTLNESKCPLTSFDHTSVHPVFSAPEPHLLSIKTVKANQMQFQGINRSAVLFHALKRCQGSVWTCLGTLAPKNINIHYSLLHWHQSRGFLGSVSQCEVPRFASFWCTHTHHFTHLHINFRLVSLSFILDILRNKVKEWWALKKWYDITFIRGSVGWMTSKSDWPQQGARSKDVKLWSTKCHKSWWTCANCCEFVLTPINFHSLPSRF